MKKISALILVSLLVMVGTVWGHSRGVTELAEGNVRKNYVPTELIGARGYVLGDWRMGQIRVEVFDFPRSEMGFEVFLAKINVDAFRKTLFVGGHPKNGVLDPLPPFKMVSATIKGVKSLGDLTMNGKNQGMLVYQGGENFYAQGYNMMMIFQKVTEGMHDAPEDMGKLVVECNGPLEGTRGSSKTNSFFSVAKE